MDAYRQPYIPFYPTSRSSSAWHATGSSQATSWWSTRVTRRLDATGAHAVARLRHNFPYVARDAITTLTLLCGAARLTVGFAADPPLRAAEVERPERFRHVCDEKSAVGLPLEAAHDRSYAPTPDPQPTT